jgi:predicted enzyme related to lactoylglutathione lyase
MRRTMTAILGLTAVAWSMWVPADVAVMAVRLGAKDVVTLAKFYDAAFGLKEIDRVGQPPTEIIMRYATSVAEAKAGSSPEFLLTRREPGAANDSMPHAIFHVSDMNATLAAAKSAGATPKGNVASVKIGSMPVKVAQLVDPEGNVLELMELPKGTNHLQHP